MLSFNGYDIGMARQHHTTPIGWSNGGVKIRLLPRFIIYQETFYPILREIIFNVMNKFEVGIATGGIEADKLL